MSRYNDSSAVRLERFPAQQQRQEESRQQLEVLENRSARRQKPAALPYGKYAVILACVFAVALCIVSGYMRLAALNLENSRLRQQISTLESEENALSAKKEQLYNLSYVEEYARDTLGMVKLDRSQIHYLEMESGDRMILAQAAAKSDGEGLWSRLSQAFSTVLEYLN